jgi:hypothetical protein
MHPKQYERLRAEGGSVHPIVSDASGAEALVRTTPPTGPPKGKQQRTTKRQASAQAVSPFTLPGETLPIEPILIRLSLAQKISGFSRSDLYRRAARGEIIFVKSGNRVLVDFTSLKAACAALPRAELNSDSYA